MVLRTYIAALFVAFSLACSSGASSSSDDTSDSDQQATDDDHDVGDASDSGPAPLINAFTASSTSLPIGGGTTTLAWDVDGATSLAIDCDVGDVTGTSQTNVMVRSPTTFTLTATNAAGPTSQTVTVHVAAPTGLPSITSFTADNTNLPIGGGDVHLSWATTDAQTLLLDPEIGDVFGRTSYDVHVTATTSYKLTAQNSYGNASDVVMITVQVPPPPDIVSFTASPSVIAGAGYVTLSWTVNNYDTLIIDNGVGDVTLDFGTLDIWVASTRSYTLTASNAHGDHDTAIVTVIVTQ